MVGRETRREPRSRKEVALQRHDNVVADLIRPPSGSVTPRTRTTGRPLVLPEASSAVEASSSATATIVERITRPVVSGPPRWSSRGPKPATPRATSTMPQRHGRPKESLITMAGRSGGIQRQSEPARARWRWRCAPRRRQGQAASAYPAGGSLNGHRGPFARARRWSIVTSGAPSASASATYQAS